MPKYDHKKIEKKWKKNWEKSGVYKTKETSDKPKYYILDMFPYPSGAGLHVGHPKGYIATDVMARMKMMQGYNVLHPMGWDAYGLPAENYAIANKVHPAEATEKNIATFKKQLGLLGFTYDWDREVNTTDPEYYKWTQWAFLQMFKRGLVYESYEPINWCPTCQTGLANEDLEDGKCERCGTLVEKKPMRQWVLKITKYADRLLNDLEKLKEWPESIKTMQREWIGRSEGINFKHKVKDLDIEFEVYDSVPQTFLAQTFVIIAPEHPLVEKLVKGTKQEKEVLEFVEKIKKKKLNKKFDIDEDMEGVFTGRYSENYMGTGRDLPIWVASFALMDYGTGIVGCSAHDDRDFKFAKKYNLPLHEVVEPLIVKEDGVDAFRKDMPITERTATVCVVKHWSEDKYMGIRWLKNDWQGFVIGGIEEGEEASSTGVREVFEETGYKNVEFVKMLGSKVHGKFFQAAKQENRVAHFVPALFKLKDGERIEVAANEKALHEVIWLTQEEMDKFVNRDDMRIIWNRVRGVDQPIVHNGILLEPEEFKGREWSEVREDIIQCIVDKGLGKRAVHYKLRDWVFSRQRYWGEPIPLVHCEKCGVVPVPENELPLELPKVKNYAPTGTGESPLANIEKWVNTKCPECGGPAKRETNTMPQWAGSCWYYLAFSMLGNQKSKIKNQKYEWRQEAIDYWNPVDLYVGGAEHATRHLIYARFWHKFLYDIGRVKNDEPFTRLQNVGLILAEDGRKMSKRWGNVINPDDVVEEYGADAMRVYEMFMGPFDQPCAWSTNGLVGTRRFIERVYNLREKMVEGQSQNFQFPISNFQTLLHQTIKKVTEDIEKMHYNTAIAQMMTLVNEMNKEEKISNIQYSIFIKLLSPFAPHVAEEIWIALGNKESIFLSDWPKYDLELVKDSEITLAVQVNGKLRDTLTVSADISEEEAKQQALASDKAQKWLEGKMPKKVIYIKGKLVSIVV